ncbi:PREDICTED: uncharacterized protein LOC107172311 [Diuraphis noxia]|uniref:uncharacterized protein LOC107172311 n=1 Tax=Diuraphis noxia TaxID=143948 RepID=UPI0007635E61|nr:PREDICTED: uncharacterized protein LOC107172311 [Diuraphis noxia]
MYENAMATISNESDSSQKNTSNEESDDKDDENNMFECNICLESARDAVVSICGHLFWLVLLLNENYIDNLSLVQEPHEIDLRAACGSRASLWPPLLKTKWKKNLKISSMNQNQ